MDAHRFDETIGGGRYTVEVTRVQGNPTNRTRWRASLLRSADIPSAVMPFYGDTPPEALEALVRWLSQAHGATADSEKAAAG